jgi:hypothetical protein
LALQELEVAQTEGDPPMVSLSPSRGVGAVITIWSIVLILAVLGLGALYPEYGEICSEGENAQPKECATYSMPRYALIEAFTRLQTYQSAVSALSAAITAIFTVVLAWVTQRLAHLTNINAEAARESARAAAGMVSLGRDEFIATHRPHIIVRQFSLDCLQAGQEIRVYFNVTNTGQNDATIDFIGMDVWIRKGRKWEPPGASRRGGKPENFTTLASGESQSADRDNRSVRTRSLVFISLRWS